MHIIPINDDCDIISLRDKFENNKAIQFVLFFLQVKKKFSIFFIYIRLQFGIRNNGLEQTPIIGYYYII
jgi:hypothetical protein